MKKKTKIKITKGKFEDLIIDHIFGKVLEIAKYGSVTLYYDDGEHFASWENGNGWYYSRFERIEPEEVELNDILAPNCKFGIGGE